MPRDGLNINIMKIRNELGTVELISISANYGRGANDGAYYPVGLLSLGTNLKRNYSDIDVSIIDTHHESEFNPKANYVGISASSTLNYKNVLFFAQKAKDNGATVILGGPHATQLADQILKNRKDIIDYIIRGNGEIPFEMLLKKLRTGMDLSDVPSLSWRTSSGDIRHNPLIERKWQYDDFLPLDMSLLRSGIRPYWEVFKKRIDEQVYAAFVIFTHFGCGYREFRKRLCENSDNLSRWCSYCSLNEPLRARTGDAIVKEAIHLLEYFNVPKGANVLLKCYGDNVGPQKEMLKNLAAAIEKSDRWQQYRIGWTFYSQSSYVTKELCMLLKRIGTKNLYIGFDAINGNVQRMNGLGTSVKSHYQAVNLCSEYDIKIQAGFVLGCAGEDERTLTQTLRFAEHLALSNNLERIATGVLFVIPGSPAYDALCEKEPWIREIDDLPTEEIQLQWIRHFCPQLNDTPLNGLRKLQWYANEIDKISPGPHSSMGFFSERMIQEQRKSI